MPAPPRELRFSDGGSGNVADAGGAALVHNVLDVLVPEVAQRAQHRIGRRLAQPAKAGLLDRVAEFDQQLQVGHGAGAVADARQQGVHLRRAGAAGNALAARLVMQNSMKKRATLTMHEVSSMTIMPPEPMIEPTCHQRVVADAAGRACSAGMQPPEGPPVCTALKLVPVRARRRRSPR